MSQTQHRRYEALSLCSGSDLSWAVLCDTKSWPRCTVYLPRSPTYLATISLSKLSRASHITFFADMESARPLFKSLHTQVKALCSHNSRTKKKSTFNVRGIRHMSFRGLLDWPPELLDHIVSFLPMASQWLLSLTCHELLTNVWNCHAVTTFRPRGAAGLAYVLEQRYVLLRLLSAHARRPLVLCESCFTLHDYSEQLRRQMRKPRANNIHICGPLHTSKF